MGSPIRESSVDEPSTEDEGPASASPSPGGASVVPIFHTSLLPLLRMRWPGPGGLGHLSIAGERPRIVEALRSRLPGSLAHAVSMEWSHARMGLTALSRRDAGAWIVHELYVQHAALLLPMLWACRRPVYVLLHGNRPLTERDRLKRAGLALLNLCLRSPRFNVVLFEIPDDVVPPRFRTRTARKLVVPFPAREDSRPSLGRGERLLPEQKVVIGAVGMLRPGKPLGRLLPVLKGFVDANRESCELLVGKPSWQAAPDVAHLGIRFVDTDDEAAYLAALRRVHVLALDLDREDYSYRTSAVASDAASSGCRVVAPDLPVVTHQIGWPVPVGVPFRHHDELHHCLTAAVNLVRTRGQDDHWEWREARTAEAIAARLWGTVAAGG